MVDLKLKPKIKSIVYRILDKTIMMDLYSDTSYECSKLITERYSTSFSLGIKAFDKKFRDPIYAIYGFVRYADEIVDTFHNHNKALDENSIS